MVKNSNSITFYSYFNIFTKNIINLMDLVGVIWWVCLFVVVYTYLGYGVLLYGLVSIKRGFQKKHQEPSAHLPEVTLLVAAYNEEDYIEDKILNSLALDYPKDKLHFLFVTDGSSDRTPEIVKQYPQIKLLHELERRGKIAATHRAMPHVQTPVVVYTDANTSVNRQAIRNIVRHFNNEEVGAVACEKRIRVQEADNASSAGEGFYWKYESALKKWDYELYSVVGAAGELFAVRTALYEDIPSDTIIEDFYLTLRIAKKGYRVAYEPNAYASETASSSVNEELKRKIRIAAGGIQAITRLKGLLNIFRYGTLSFQYISHRVLRWTITPVALLLVFLLNGILVAQGSLFFEVTLVAQLVFYCLAWVGYLLEGRKIKRKLFFIPYYFFIMNYAVYRGFIRYFTGSQSVLWERAQRAKV